LRRLSILKPLPQVSKRLWRMRKAIGLDFLNKSSIALQSSTAGLDPIVPDGVAIVFPRHPSTARMTESSLAERLCS
jgi:hypothetical protein